MTIVLTVVAEARRDATVVKALTERVVGEAAGAPVAVTLEGPTPPDEFVRWSALPKLLQQRKVLPWPGHFGGRPGKPDAIQAANALRLVRSWIKAGGRPHAVVLQRDVDKQPERAEGLEQGVSAEPLSVPVEVPVVLGVAKAKLEAWAICAFEPSDDQERKRLKTLRQELGFDPRERSHELDASEEQAKRSAKRVLATLLGTGDEAFYPLCESTPLHTLRQRGQGNGLASFLDAVRALDLAG